MQALEAEAEAQPVRALEVEAQPVLAMAMAEQQPAPVVAVEPLPWADQLWQLRPAE